MLRMLCYEPVHGSVSHFFGQKQLTKQKSRKRRRTFFDSLLTMADDDDSNWGPRTFEWPRPETAFRLACDYGLVRRPPPPGRSFCRRGEGGALWVSSHATLDGLGLRSGLQGQCVHAEWRHGRRAFAPRHLF